MHCTNPQGATTLRDKIEPNEKPTEIPESVQKGVHITRKASGDSTVNSMECD